MKSSETVGYSRKGKISGESEIAIVPLGYADGIDRKLGNKNGSTFIHGTRVPVIGNICMDMLMLDVTGIGVKPGEKVEILVKTSQLQWWLKKQAQFHMKF